MLKRNAATLLILTFVLLSGCVLQSEYNAKLREIDNLKKNVSGRDDSISKLETDKAGLEADLAELKKDLDEIKNQNKALTENNAGLNDLLKAKKGELNEKITELSSRIADREKELSAKNSEIQALSREKEKAVQEKEKSIAELKKTYNSLVGEMSEEIKKGEITITQLKDKLSVNMVEKILFDSGSADIKKDGKKVIDRVAEILSKVTDKQIRVEGYTDNVPISSRLALKFPTNWELSTARATTVARHLLDKGIDPRLVSATGYGEYRPVAANDTEEGRAKNRRIEISLVPKEAEIAAPQAGGQE